jgi:hypothetical protein
MYLADQRGGTVLLASGIPFVYNISMVSWYRAQQLGGRTFDNLPAPLDVRPCSFSRRTTTRNGSFLQAIMCTLRQSFEGFQIRADRRGLVRFGSPYTTGGPGVARVKGFT